jgi:hypothetical protein
MTVMPKLLKLISKTKNNSTQRKESINEKSLARCSQIIQSFQDEKKYNEQIKILIEKNIINDVKLLHDVTSLNQFKNRTMLDRSNAMIKAANNAFIGAYERSIAKKSKAIDLTSSTASESEVELPSKTNRSIIINVP